VPTAHFDLVVAPRHDGLEGPNVVTSSGALHRITPAKLAAARAPLDARLTGLPRPLVAVLIGGSSRHVRLTPAIVATVAAQLAALAQRDGAGLAISTSRRTGAAVRQVLAAGLAGTSAWIWDGSGANPYLAMLASADAILVTGDSVSMVSEAAATGSPVHVIEVEGAHPRLAAFHAALRARGATRPFRGRLERWSYPPLDDTARVAARVRALVA
jgi:mitochondrial fission protein ELM1